MAIDLRIPVPQPTDLPETEDILGQAFGPGDVIAAGQLYGRSPGLDLYLVKRLTTTDAKGRPLGGDTFKIVGRNLGGTTTNSPGMIRATCPSDKDSTLLAGRSIKVQWTLDMILAKLWPEGPYVTEYDPVPREISMLPWGEEKRNWYDNVRQSHRIPQEILR